MNTEELKETIENCMHTDSPERAANDILFYCQYDDVPKVIEILIEKLKSKNEN